LAGLPLEVAVGDLNDRSSLERALEGCDALYHVAADYRLWVPNAEEIYKTNVYGTRNLMLAAFSRGISRIVYTSSVATLGLNPDGSPADEDTPLAFEDMIGHYKRSKFLAEAEVSRLVKEQGLPAIIVNPSTPIGPRDIKPTPTGKMIVEAAAGRMPAYVDTGLNLVHVDDVAEGHILAFKHGQIGQRYVLGGYNMCLKDILAEIAAITGRPCPKIRLPHGLILPIAYVAEAWARIFGLGEPFVTVDGVRLARKFMYFSSEKARHDLGFSSRPVKEALIDAVNWFLEHGYLADRA